MEIQYDNLRHFGAQLRTDRKELHMSARQVAKNADMSAVYLLTLENALNRKTGRPSRPSAEIVARLATVLQKDPGQYFYLAGYNPETTGLPDLEDTPGINILEYAASGLLSLAFISQKDSADYLRGIADRVESGQFEAPNLNSMMERNLQRAEIYRRTAEEVEQIKTRLITALSGLEESSS